jgi:hypothetical protein
MRWWSAVSVALTLFVVIPAQAGIQYSLAFLDSRLRGSDEDTAFFRKRPALRVTRPWTEIPLSSTAFVLSFKAHAGSGSAGTNEEVTYDQDLPGVSPRNEL